MSELCAVHKIVAAPDGRCVLCRRPKLSFQVEDESVASKTFTALLGLGLLATMGFVAYTFTLPSPSAASRERGVVLQGSASLTETAEQGPQSAPPEPRPPAPEPATLTSIDPTAKPAAPIEESAPVKKRRVRTVGEKIVDARLIEARKSVRVTMYSAPWCFICDRARTFLEAREVDLVDYNVDEDAAAEKRLEQLNPAGSIPTFIVEGKTIVGFHPWGLEDAIDLAAQEHYCAKTSQGAVCERIASAK